MESNLEVDFLNLIHNQEFVDWVINPDQKSDLYWNQIIIKYPTHKKEIDKAIFIVQSLLKEEKKMDTESVLNLWNRIEKEIINRKKTIPLLRWAVAASILLAIGISSVVFYQMKLSEPVGIEYNAIARIEPSGNEIKLILSDKSEKLLDYRNSVIKYDQDGKIEINSDETITQSKSENETNAEQLNQLVVPLGKRSVLTLSDGTKLWLNSGSRAIYPVRFLKKEREIYVEGEAFLEVAHNAEKPFFVVTNHVKIRVLGTKFNVSAYPEDTHTSTVLVEGSIQALTGSKKVLMKENQLLTLNNESGTISLEEVNVLEFVSWKDGWMHCNKEKLEDIATKLERYYNINIQFKDIQAKEMTLTGKLDLKSNCEEIFKAISSTAPIEFELVNGEIILSSKN